MLVYALVIHKGAILMCQPTFEGGERWSWELPYTSIFPPQDNTTEDTARKVIRETTGLSLPVSGLVGYCESYATGKFVGSYDSSFIYLMDAGALAEEHELASPAGSSSRVSLMHRNQIDDVSVQIGDFSRLVAKRVLDQNPTMLHKREEFLANYMNEPPHTLYMRPYTFFM